jgi:DNA polymerase-3 subunit gamma/tau
MTQALYRKWRPLSWDEVIGQDHVIQTLRNAVKTEHVTHAYLFAGPRGTGKTTTARLLAKAVNCLNPDPSTRPCNECDNCQAINAGRFLDLIEIDGASNTSVDDVRDLRDKINFSPNLGRFKVYVIDEVHMLSTAAFNALLKTLEEPPPHAIFVLATTEVHKIPATVLSRCQRHEFRRIPVTDIVANLEQLSEKENLQTTPDALTLIARQSTGSLRDAISLLDQLASTGEPITLELTQSILGTTTSQAVIEVIDALLVRDPADGLDHIHQALDGGSDARQFARQIVEYLRSLLLNQLGEVQPSNVPPETETQMEEHAKRFNTPDLLHTIKQFNQAATNTRATWQPALPLEVAFIESCLHQLDTSPSSTQTQASTADHPQIPPPNKTHPAKPTPKSDRIAETKTAPSSSKADSSSQILTKNWSQILKLVHKERPNLSGLLNSCQTRHMDGNLLILGFSSDLLKNQMSQRENTTIIQNIISQVLGTEVSIRCVTSTAKNTQIPSDVDEDGIVASALRDLGGEIVDIQ